ncbi:EP300-interacting inhibitor of differentiation 1-like [Sorex araneus]|uniref:EP300-interacting inhibitor of differentiation 1-like n=1 Tax=Sorex araneus TaxID=42254 RepID=UPI002433736C|nr:EP300-interacting inhibitor of differentiation 1-like [Sorex araneus]
MSQQPADANAPREEVGGGGGGRRRQPARARSAELWEGRFAEEAGAGRVAADPEAAAAAAAAAARGPDPAAFPRPERDAAAVGPDLAPAQPPIGEEVPNAHGGRLRGFNEPNWVFMDVCRAREVAQDASWQARYPNVYLDYFTFIEDLFASVALSRLAAELGCDRLKDRE